MKNQKRVKTFVLSITGAGNRIFPLASYRNKICRSIQHRLPTPDRLLNDGTAKYLFLQKPASFVSTKTPYFTHSRTFLLKNSSTVSWDTEQTLSSTATQTPFRHSPIQKVPASSTLSSRLYLRIRRLNSSTTWREPLMWHDEPIHTVIFIFLFSLFIIFIMSPGIKISLPGYSHKPTGKHVSIYL
ncbi:hypothetical protein Cst_c18880 [Thermoclostridium stercorarium subsp. stercorarium DSM 8532]|uniref:Uncharacterized protein n=1 Tax=Thermoclostridium stercorarium (strain ATCC 35414 / DSM 8532 / NCIMB 11754) TaxID=1121335 RepID=L7VL30_THES1|nr:hypothetical protein Cst_c18880 [Thermoclostridium stercorarium subsp. stercorarium DSM 8532]